METTTTITTEEFLLLRDFVEKECGIALAEEKKYLLESRLANLLVENGCRTFGEFYLKVRSEPGTALKDKIVDVMTTNETLWFRDEGPFKVLQERLFPEFARFIEKGQKSRVNIWSAACSTGQEPYSIGIMAHEYARKSGDNRFITGQMSILATDISASVLMLAKNARYNSIAISRGMPAEYQERYFTEQPPLWCLQEEIKNLVRFQKFNLQHSFESLGKFDIILLRNVAIYFSTEFKMQLFKKIAQALNPGGYLFLGGSESLLGYNDDFKMLEHDRCLFYQLRS